jgi:hypothetical protein
MRGWWLCVLVACNGTDDGKGDPDPTPDDGDTDTDTDTDSDTDTDTDVDTSTDTETGPTDTDPGSDLVGRTYRLDVSGANWVEPANIGTLISDLLGSVQILAMPVDEDATHIDWLVALAGSGVQAQCLPSQVAPSTVWVDPDFELAPFDLELDRATGLGFEDLEVAGAFSSDLSRLDGVTIRGRMDTRPLVDVIEPGGPDDVFCILASSLGVTCIPCTDGGEFCLTTGLSQVDSPYLAGVVVDERTEADIANDPSCN